MPGIYEALETIAGAIVADATLQALCQSYWQKNLQAFVGVDDQYLPEDAGCPMLLMIATNRELSPGTHMRSTPARCCIAIRDDQDPKLAATNVTTFRGAARLDAVVWRALEVVCTVTDTNNRWCVSPTSGPDDMTIPPVFKAWFGLDIQHESDITYS